MRRDLGPFGFQAAIAASTPAPKSRLKPTGTRFRVSTTNSNTATYGDVSLNRAVAVAKVEGQAAALAIVDALAQQGDLAEYHLLHAARADFARRLGAWKMPRRAIAGRCNW